MELQPIKNLDKVEKFSKSYYFQAQLPMDHYMFKVTLPKRYLANHLDNEYGFPLVTYCDGDFVRVRLNEEIVVVTKRVSVWSFNETVLREMSLVQNRLYDFLRNFFRIAPKYC